VHERPPDIDDAELAGVLLGQWQLAETELRYLPVGFGGYHWLAVDPAGSRWFVTVSDVGDDLASLAATMETAAWLASGAGLDFVVAPVPTLTGPALGRLSARYAVTVFPFADGVPGRFGSWAAGADRADVIDLLAALHSVPLPGDRTSFFEPGAVPVRRLELASRTAADRALADLGMPWHGGPFAEPGRALLHEYEQVLRDALDWFDELVRQVRRAGRPLVITHGEPHPGNFLRDGSRRKLVDWDTVGLASPERDLWWVVTDDGQEASRYAERTGRTVSPDAVDLYRLRWSLDDISLFLAEIRAPHQRTADTEVSWAGLQTTLAALSAR
jgi:spectinomycin phosphotransferase